PHQALAPPGAPRPRRAPAARVAHAKCGQPPEATIPAPKRQSILGISHGRRPEGIRSTPSPSRVWGAYVRPGRWKRSVARSVGSNFTTRGRLGGDPDRVRPIAIAVGRTRDQNPSVDEGLLRRGPSRPPGARVAAEDGNAEGNRRHRQGTA